MGLKAEPGDKGGSGHKGERAASPLPARAARLSSAVRFPMRKAWALLKLDVMCTQVLVLAFINCVSSRSDFTSLSLRFYKIIVNV